MEVDLCEGERGTRKDEERLLQVRCREVAQMVLDLLSVEVQEILIPFLGVFLDQQESQVREQPYIYEILESHQKVGHHIE